MSRLPLSLPGTLLFAALTLSITRPASGQAVQMLWSRVAPGSSGTNATDTVNLNPYLRLYPVAAGTGNGAAAIVCPGGGYVNISGLKEGIAVARWLNTLGISAFVLRYRLGTSTGPNYGIHHHPSQMWDVQRAMRWVRANAAQYGIDVNRVGIVGFSAGGHLASTAATHYDAGNPSPTSADSINYYPGAHDSVDNFSCRPNFQILGYPVITMDPTFTHTGSRNALLGSTNPPAARVLLLSNEKQVTADTPPAFMVHSTDDGTVPIRNSQAYSDSLQRKGVQRKLVIFPNGGHGYGLANGMDTAPNVPLTNTWPDSAAAWLRSLGFLNASTALFRHDAQGARGLGRGLFISAEADGFGRIWSILGRELPSRNRAPFVPFVAAPQ